MISLKIVDLSKGHEHEHPDIKTDGTQYLVKYDGWWCVASFGRQWYGLTAGYPPGQFDAPDFNHSLYEEVYEICDRPEQAPDIRNPRKVRIKK